MTLDVLAIASLLDMVAKLKPSLHASGLHCKGRAGVSSNGILMLMQADEPQACLAGINGRAETVASVQHDVSTKDTPLPRQHVDFHLTAACAKRAVHQLLFTCKPTQPSWCDASPQNRFTVLQVDRPDLMCSKLAEPSFPAASPQNQLCVLQASKIPEVL